MYRLSGVVVFSLCLCFADSFYFTMKEIRMNLPGYKASFPSNDYPLVRMFIHPASNHLLFSLNGNGSLVNMNPNTGDVYLGKRHDINELDSKKFVISASDGSEGDKTSLNLNVYRKKQLNCEDIVEDLCFWSSVTYQIKENISTADIGSLTSPFLSGLCPNYKIEYIVEKGSNHFTITQAPKAPRSSILQITKKLNRENNMKRVTTVICKTTNPQGDIQEVRKNLVVQVLDVDDNLPEPQEKEIHVYMNQNAVPKNYEVTHDDLLFIDKDSLEVNNYTFRILNDKHGILQPNCTALSADHFMPKGTVLHCKLKFTEHMHFDNGSTYSVVLQVNDTKYVEPPGLVNMTIHLNINKPSHFYPASMVKRPLKLYPSGDVRIFRTAGPFARVIQPQKNNDARNFTINVNGPEKDIFRVTAKEGIVYVYDVKALFNSQEYIKLNITWLQNSRIEFDEIDVRLIDEATPTCCDKHSLSIEEWMFCSEFQTAEECESETSCAIATGGANNVIYHNAQRCEWRGMQHQGTEITNLYNTCTPDKITCPDNICDSLEELAIEICPQDCTRNVAFPIKLNPKTGRGIYKSSKTCFCDVTGMCHCADVKKSKKVKPPEKITNCRGNYTSLSGSEIRFNETNEIEPNVSKRTGNFTGKILGIEMAKCGTPCLLGIAAGSLFLAGAVALIVICWRLDRVHKAVREKYSQDNLNLAAPLTEYLRNEQDPLPIHFDMTTSLADKCIVNIINKYKPDPKWEFPRNQLQIEQTLGEGEFGRVLRAKALDIGSQPGYTIVAVKTLKEDARETELNDLMSEFQLLKEVSHPNVIRLLGICTTPGAPIYLIIEYAEYGSLRNYLRRHRHMKSENRNLPSTISGEINDSHYDEPKVTQVTPKEILSFAWQICNGMAYLSDVKLVHRDLAARNVLLASGKICKISDFGLTRDIYEDDAYFKRSKGRVPVKWMAPESLADHIYTSKSDVWSFGVLAWELVTLGANPYPGIAVQNLFHLLRQGYRMERPDNCSTALYKIMRSCWELSPEQRPTFHELAKTFEKLLGDGVDYLDLSNSAIHNRSYFCSPFEETPNIVNCSTEKLENNPLNYLSKTQSYVKCGAIDKFSLEDNMVSRENDEVRYQNQLPEPINTQGYETPIKHPTHNQTPTNENPQYYTDMNSGSSNKIDNT